MEYLYDSAVTGSTAAVRRRLLLPAAMALASICGSWRGSKPSGRVATSEEGGFWGGSCELVRVCWVRSIARRRAELGSMLNDNG